jgi:AcrR family transcriptional regulator
MKEIVDATHLSKGAFYHYFKSKEQLFLEVVESIFARIVDLDFSGHISASLREYCEDYLARLESTYNTLLAKDVISPSFNLSYYSLLFDAMRFFPDFKQRMISSNHAERSEWLEVIGAARRNGEIRSSLSDDQVADIFIHTSGGVGMDNIMSGSSGTTIDKLRRLWDGFYASLRPTATPLT